MPTNSDSLLLLLALRLLVVVLLGKALVAEELGVHSLGGDEPFLLLLVEAVVPVRLRRGVSHCVVYFPVNIVSALDPFTTWGVPHGPTLHPRLNN